MEKSPAGNLKIGTYGRSVDPRKSMSASPLPCERIGVIMLFPAPSHRPETCPQDDPECSPSPPVARGIIHRRHVAGDRDLRYALLVSNNVSSKIPLFIAVHGIQRGVNNQARLFAPFIDLVGGVLVAPLFQKDRFPDYQRLGRLGRGDRADMALKRIVKDVSRILGHHFQQWAMFGYSGGGQFVHRYAMANPRQVKRMAIAAPGWFTFPDRGHPFPRGIGSTSALPDVRFDPARFLKIPTLVMVGENDILRDVNLNKAKKVGRQQGINRMDRGQRWVAAMSATASRFKTNTPFIFKKLPGCGHSFSECMQTGKMGRMVVDFLFEDDLT
jgi:dienelactone hydrolase